MEKYKIVYSREVTERLIEIVDYLKKNWSITIADNFLTIFFEKIIVLAVNPKIGRLSKENPTIRSISITKHNRLYYQFDEDVIKLVSLFDTRQDPTKNKFD